MKRRQIMIDKQTKDVPEKCYYCSKWVVIGGVGMCIDDIEDEEREDDR